MSNHNVTGTFFILGYIAKKHPQLVKKIVSEGHEIGSHGFWHKKVYNQSKSEFRHELLSSKDVLEDIIGQQVNMFRAPSWSISKDTLWALEILEEEGFICDSSIQHFKTYLSGISHAPVTPYHPVVNGRKLKLLEVPPMVLPLGKFRLPFSGGFYLRALPKWFIRYGLSKINKKGPGMIYVHPWEVDVDQPRLKAALLPKTIHYFNLRITLNKLENLLQNFDFTSMSKLLVSREYPSLPVISAEDVHYEDDGSVGKQ